MRCRYVLLFVVTVLLVPVIVNLLLLCRNPFPIIEIVGNRVDWLAFLGSYVGGIVPALVSIVMLYYTLVNSFNQARIDRQERRLHFLQQDLGNRCSHINFMTVLNEVTTQSQNINKELYDLDNHRLSTLYENVNANIASAKLFYNGGSEKQQEFINCYTEALEKIVEEIRNLQDRYMVLAMAQFSNDAKNVFLAFAISSLQKLRTMQNNYDPLINKLASEIITEERQRILELDKVKFL